MSSRPKPEPNGSPPKPAITASADRAERLDLYKLMVEMADRVSQRRQTANSFYLSINTLLVGGSAYLGSTSPSWKSTILISVAGTLVCIYWHRSIESYKTLNDAKFAVINEVERDLVVKPFTDEWSKLDPDGDGKRHKPFHKTEKLVPRVFFGVYAFQAVTLLPWGSAWRHLLSSIC